MPIPLFQKKELEQICAVLAETQSGLKGWEIEELLKGLGMGGPMPNAPNKRTRLFEALWLEENNEGSGECVIRLIEAAMRPISYSLMPELFESRRRGLNVALAFCGFELDESGKVIPRDKAITLADAQQRADRLRSELEQRNVHPDVLRFCQAELLQENYFHAVFEATKSVADKIRSLTGLSEDGAKLVDAAMSLSTLPPILAINDLQSETHRSEHTGFANLMRGMFGVFRNTAAHAPKITWPIDEQDALDLLSLVSYMHRRLDAASVRRRASQH